jgi:hypothetical protein
VQYYSKVIYSLMMMKMIWYDVTLMLWLDVQIFIQPLVLSFLSPPTSMTTTTNIEQLLKINTSLQFCIAHPLRLAWWVSIPWCTATIPTDKCDPKPPIMICKET